MTTRDSRRSLSRENSLSSTASNRTNDYDTDSVRQRWRLSSSPRARSLTPAERQEILSQDRYTGYTYADSISYRSDGSTDFLHPYLNQRRRVDFGDGGDVSTYRVVSSPAFNGTNERYPWNSMRGFLQRTFSFLVVVVQLGMTLGVFGFGAGYWFARRTGYWLMALAFPTIVGPIMAWKATYGRTKRTYHAVRYAHEQGYLDWFWTRLQNALAKVTTNVAYIASLGNIDLSSYIGCTYDLRQRRASQSPAKSPRRRTATASPLPPATEAYKSGSRLGQLVHVPLHYSERLGTGLRRTFYAGDRGSPSLLRRGADRVVDAVPIENTKAIKQALPWIALSLLVVGAGVYAYNNGDQGIVGNVYRGVVNVTNTCYNVAAHTIRATIRYVINTLNAVRSRLLDALHFVWQVVYNLVRRVIGAVTGTIHYVIDAIGSLFDSGIYRLSALKSAPVKALKSIDRGARSAIGYTTETLKDGGNAIYNHVSDVAATTQDIIRRSAQNVASAGLYAQQQVVKLLAAGYHAIDDYVIRVLAAAPRNAFARANSSFGTLRDYTIAGATTTRDAAARGLAGVSKATGSTRAAIGDIFHRFYNLIDLRAAGRAVGYPIGYAIGYAKAAPSIALSHLSYTIDLIRIYAADAYGRVTAALPERKLTPAETLVEKKVKKQPPQREIVVTSPPPAAAPIRVETVQQPTTPPPPSMDPEQVRALIREQLEQYDADKTGQPDYALESSGGELLGIGCTREYTKKSRLQSLFGIPLYYTVYGPRTVIQRNGNGLTPGECWPYEGGKGHLIVKLSRRINVTAISYEHLPLALAPEGHIQTAPHIFKIWSYQQYHPKGEHAKHLLGKFEYDSKGEALQTFNIQFKDPLFTPIIELETETNHGSEVTCLYRFRVHGTPIDNN